MSEYIIAHHGIMGQQWGVRNGPPYPLDKSDYSNAEKRAVKKADKKFDKYVVKQNNPRRLEKYSINYYAGNSKKKSIAYTNQILQRFEDLKTSDLKNNNLSKQQRANLVGAIDNEQSYYKNFNEHYTTALEKRKDNVSSGIIYTTGAAATLASLAILSKVV